MSIKKKLYENYDFIRKGKIRIASTRTRKKQEGNKEPIQLNTIVDENFPNNEKVHP